jgi:hypothetical protein
VQLVEVDPLEAQALQRSLTGLAQVLGPAVTRPLAGTGAGEAALGGDDETLGVGVERLGDQLLADLGTIGVGSVDQVDAELDGALENRNRAVVVGRRPPDSLPGDPHCPVAEPSHLEVAEAEGAGRLVAERLDRHLMTG